MAKKSNARRSAEKALKKANPVTLIFALLFLIIGAVLGVMLSRELAKNDRFELLGEKEIALASGERYTEPGVTIISFGRDISGKVIRGGDYENMGDLPKDGIYRIVYTVDDFRWGDYQLVRTVIVGNIEEAEGTGDGE